MYVVVVVYATMYPHTPTHRDGHRDHRDLIYIDASLSVFQYRYIIQLNNLLFSSLLVNLSISGSA